MVIPKFEIIRNGNSTCKEVEIGNTNGTTTIVKNKDMWMTTTTFERMIICTSTLAMYDRDVHDHLRLTRNWNGHPHLQKDWDGHHIRKYLI